MLWVHTMGSSINNVTILKEGEGESIIEKMITNSFKNSGDMRDGGIEKSHLKLTTSFMGGPLSGSVV